MQEDFNYLLKRDEGKKQTSTLAEKKTGSNMRNAGGNFKKLDPNMKKIQEEA